MEILVVIVHVVVDLLDHGVADALVSWQIRFVSVINFKVTHVYLIRIIDQWILLRKLGCRQSGSGVWLLKR